VRIDGDEATTIRKVKFMDEKGNKAITTGAYLGAMFKP